MKVFLLCFMFRAHKPLKTKLLTPHHRLWSNNDSSFSHCFYVKSFYKPEKNEIYIYFFLDQPNIYQH